MDPLEEGARLRAERDLYRHLLELGRAEDVHTLVERVLSLALEVTGALRGLVRLVPPDGDEVLVASSLADETVGAVRASFSSGIARMAMQHRRCLRVTSAAVDPRFSSLESVQRGQVDAVLCAPIEQRGVVYLEGRRGPGAFSPEDEDVVMRIANHVAPVADRLLSVGVGGDPTGPWRARLVADEIVGSSPAIAETLRVLSMVVAIPLPVLLTGATGTGKTALARVIHRSSPRAAEPFVSINCAAIPAELFESELFGAEPGAHSTATRRVQGKVDAAGAGTLFLDEVGELPMPLQPKLLQLIQSGEFYSLGAARPSKSRARVLAATNRDLRKDVEAGRFREDLYHRLNGFPVDVPPLDARRSDVPLLADAILERIVDSLSLPRLHLDAGARASLALRSWPGNVRELENVVQRAAVFAAGEGATAVQMQHLDPVSTGAERRDLGAWSELTVAFQRQVLLQALQESEGNVSETARRLGLTRSHLYNLLRAHGLRS